MYSSLPERAPRARRLGAAATAVLLMVMAVSGTGCVREKECGDGVVTLSLLLPPCPAPPEPTAPEPPPPPSPEEVADDRAPSLWPVEDPARRVSSPFGQRRRRGHAHKGIDIESPQGTPVRATAPGQITFSGRHGAYGNIIIIDHDNGYETAYAHVGKCLVNKGECVQRGQEIAEVGNTGNATAFHVHYEVRHNGTPVDPAPWLP